MAIQKKKKVILIIGGVLLGMFAVYNAVWFYYKYTYFDKLIANHPKFVDDEVEGEDQTYIYRDPTPRSKDTTFNYSVTFPLSYLSWTGNYAMAQNLYMDFDTNQVVNDYLIDIMIKPTLFNGYQYDLTITDYTDYKQTYAMKIDGDGNLIKDYDGSAEIILSKASAEIKETVDAVNNALGLK